MSEPGPYDDDLVRAASVKEPTGVVRAPRAYRIAAQHEQVAPWQAPAAVPVVVPVRRWTRLRGVGRAVVTTVAVVGLLVWLHVVGSDRYVPDPVNPWATGAPSVAVPVPADAAAAPLGRPAAAPPGQGGYAFLFEHDGRPVTFDPCRPVHYVARYDGAPPGADQVLQAAVTQLSAATGLSLVFDGLSDEAPAQDRPAHQPGRYGDRWAPVLIAWSSEADTASLAGRTGGYASPVVLDPDGLGPRIVTGQVVMDVEVQHPEAVQAVLLHELAHLVGLDHTDDPADLMHADSAVATGLTPGSLRGLHHLGQGPCFS